MNQQKGSSAYNGPQHNGPSSSYAISDVASNKDLRPVYWWEW